MCHLTPEKAVVPYNICFGLYHFFGTKSISVFDQWIFTSDLENNIWVASKGGLFKFDPAGKELLFCLRNDFPKKVAPYTQVLLHKTKVLDNIC